MKAIASFSLFGLFIGSLCGLSSSPLATGLMPLFFTFFGGSVFVFYEKLTPVTRGSAYLIVGAVSAGCLIGLYGAIIIASNHLIGPDRVFSEKEKGYLRSGEMSKIEPILILLEQKQIEPDVAAKKIREKMTSGG